MAEALSSAPFRLSASPSPCRDPSTIASKSMQVSVAEWLARLTAVGITPQAVVFIATTAAIYSLGHGLRTFTAVPRSTQPSVLRGTVK